MNCYELNLQLPTTANSNWSNWSGRGVYCSRYLESLPMPIVKSFIKSLQQNYLILLTISPFFAHHVTIPLIFSHFVVFFSRSPIFFHSYLPSWKASQNRQGNKEFHTTLYLILTKMVVFKSNTFAENMCKCSEKT